MRTCFRCTQFSDEILKKNRKAEKVGGKKMDPVTVGCDVELECYKHDGKFVRADSVLLGKEFPRPDAYDDWEDKRYTEPTEEQRKERLLDCPIGLDGNPIKLEFRPTPAVDPVEMIASLKYLIRDFTVAHPEIELRCTGQEVSLSGHIHFGHPIFKQYNYEMFHALMSMLDEAAGTSLLFSCPSQARRQSKYFAISQYRVKPWGFEYRTPSAWLFRDPTYAIVVIKLLQALVTDFVEASLIYGEPKYVLTSHEVYSDRLATRKRGINGIEKYLTGYELAIFKTAISNHYQRQDFIPMWSSWDIGQYVKATR